MSNRGQSNTTAPAIIIGLVAAIITWLLMSSEMVVGRYMSASESQAAMPSA